MVSKAFQVLSGKINFILNRAFLIWGISDPQKRAVYDRSGFDPEDRSGNMSSRASGFSAGPFSNGGFEGELSPEDLFNMFFGGGGGGGGGGFGPGFSGSFGGGPSE